MQHRVGRAREGHREDDAVQERLAREDILRLHSLLDELHDAASRLCREAFLLRVDGGDRGRPWQRHSQPLHQNLHRIRRAHQRTGAWAGADVILEVTYLLARLVACVIRAEYELVQLAHHDAASAALADLLRAARQHDTGDVGADAAHKDAGDDAVARGEQHKAVQQLHAGHYLDGRGDDVADDQLIAEVRHPDGHRAAGGDGSEFKRRAARL